MLTAEFGDLGRGQAHLHPERGKSQSWLEGLDRRGQNVPGGFINDGVQDLLAYRSISLCIQ